MAAVESIELDTPICRRLGVSWRLGASDSIELAASRRPRATHTLRARHSYWDATRQYRSAASRSNRVRAITRRLVCLVFFGVFNFVVFFLPRSGSVLVGFRYTIYSDRARARHILRPHTFVIQSPALDIYIIRRACSHTQSHIHTHTHIFGGAATCVCVEDW